MSSLMESWIACRLYFLIKSLLESKSRCWIKMMVASTSSVLPAPTFCELMIFIS